MGWNCIFSFISSFFFIIATCLSIHLFRIHFYKRRSVDSYFVIFAYYFAFKRLPDFCSKCKNDFVYKQVRANRFFNIFI
jgi:hypothetical protein